MIAPHREHWFVTFCLADIGKFLFNLGDVNYIDSSDVGHLASAVASVRKLQGELKLFNLKTKIREVLQIRRLYTVIEIMDHETVAVESLAEL